MSTEQNVMTKVHKAMVSEINSAIVRRFGNLTLRHPVFPAGQVVRIHHSSLFNCYFPPADGCGIVAAVEYKFIAAEEVLDAVWVYSPEDGEVYPISLGKCIPMHGEKF